MLTILTPETPLLLVVKLWNTHQAHVAERGEHMDRKRRWSRRSSERRRKGRASKCVLYAFKHRSCAKSKAVSLFVFFCRCTAADQSVRESDDRRGEPEVATWEERMRGKEVSDPLPPGVLELWEEVYGLDGENGRTRLRLEWGGTRVRGNVAFLPAGGTGELMGERGPSATDDLMTPVPRWGERQLRLGAVHFRAWQLYLDGINERAHQWKRMQESGQWMKWQRGENETES